MNRDVARSGLQPSFNLSSFLDQPTSLRAATKSVGSMDRLKNNSSAPMRADFKGSKVDGDYNAASRNQRNLNRSEVNLTKQAMYPRTQNFLGRNSSQAVSTGRKSENSAKPKTQQQSMSGH